MNSQAEIFQAIDVERSAVINKLIHWSTVNSGTSNLSGLAKMAELIEAEFSGLKDISQRITLNSTETLADDGELIKVHYGDVLKFQKRPEAEVQVLLCGHMDTVFPADHFFQSTQFKDSNTLHGPGVADMKGGLLVMIQALKAFEHHPLASSIGWEVVVNPDEETGSIGSAVELRKSAEKALVGMVYEPALADGTLAGERKGSGNFSIKVTGKSAHAGREFHQGRNAIALLSRVFSQLDEINLISTLESKSVTVNLGRVAGGGALNIVPDLAVGHFNVRMSNLQEQVWVKEKIAAIVEKANSQEGYCVELFGNFSRIPKTTNPAFEKLCRWLIECGNHLSVPIQFKATGGCCDGNNLNNAGLPNIDTLGVRGGNIHTENEFMLVDSFAERVKLSYLLLEKIALNHTEIKY